MKDFLDKYGKTGKTGESQGPRPSFFKRLLTYVFGTGLFTGFAPKAQGTFGSALFVILWVILVPAKLGWEIFAAVAVNILSIPLSTWGERLWGEDPGRITVDEFAGQAIALIGVPRKWYLLLAAFFLFRFFDVFKLPIIKNRIEKLPEGYGVTLDDTAAGILARLCMIPVKSVFK